MKYILYDTEFTAWPGSMQRGWSGVGEHRELVQLAAQKVELSQHGLEVISSFNELVKPVINPQLSEYFCQLTGIGQETVDEMGVDYASALSAFHDFAEQGALCCLAWGEDHRILLENCALYDVSFPTFGAGLGNLRVALVGLGVVQGNLSSGQLASSVGVPLQGHEHNALFDVRSMGAALDYWLKRGTITPSDIAQAACRPA